MLSRIANTARDIIALPFMLLFISLLSVALLILAVSYTVSSAPMSTTIINETNKLFRKLGGN